MKDRPSTVVYANLLQRHGAGSNETEQYKARHRADRRFVARAAALDLLFREKEEILRHAGRRR